MTASVEDPELVIRFIRDAWGLMVVRTLMRRLDGSLETVSLTRKVDIEAINHPIAFTEAIVGPVRMGPMPGRRGTPTGVFVPRAG